MSDEQEKEDSREIVIAKAIVRLNALPEFQYYIQVLQGQIAARKNKLPEKIISDVEKSEYNFLNGEIVGLATAINLPKAMELQIKTSQDNKEFDNEIEKLKERG